MISIKDIRAAAAVISLASASFGLSGCRNGVSEENPSQATKSTISTATDAPKELSGKDRNAKFVGILNGRDKVTVEVGKEKITLVSTGSGYVLERTLSSDHDVKWNTRIRYNINGEIEKQEVTKEINGMKFGGRMVMEDKNYKAPDFNHVLSLLEKGR